MKKTILDDGFQAYLTEGATLVGDAGIPMLLDLKNTQIPKGLVPFNKIGIEKNKNKYVHFYIHDYQFSQVLTSTEYSIMAEPVIPVSRATLIPVARAIYSRV